MRNRNLFKNQSLRHRAWLSKVSEKNDNSISLKEQPKAYNGEICYKTTELYGKYEKHDSHNYMTG